MPIEKQNENALLYLKKVIHHCHDSKGDGGWPMKKILIAAGVLFLLAGAIMAYGAFDLYQYMNAPIQAKNPSGAFITISPGDNFERIMEKLRAVDLIEHPFKFELTARWKGFGRKIQAGEYRLSNEMTPLEMLQALASGRVVLHSVTIPEGFNIRQVAKRIDASGLAGFERFLSAATDPKFAARLNIPADTVEGYLFPDTYSFARSAGAEKIIKTMIDELRRHFTHQWKKRAQELGFSVHEIITLASIIEKETGVADERVLIASVFHNRLAKNMRLESDPTVIYGIKDFDGNLTRSDLKKQTPYNTYRIHGLPPGPIANPGLASIRAALYPARTEYLYFVAKPDRTHHFSKTLSAHNQAVNKYQLSSGSP